MMPPGAGECYPFEGRMVCQGGPADSTLFDPKHWNPQDYGTSVPTLHTEILCMISGGMDYSVHGFQSNLETITSILSVCFKGSFEDASDFFPEKVYLVMDTCFSKLPLYRWNGVLQFDLSYSMEIRSIACNEIAKVLHPHMLVTPNTRHGLIVVQVGCEVTVMSEDGSCNTVVARIEPNLFLGSGLVRMEWNRSIWERL